VGQVRIAIAAGNTGIGSREKARALAPERAMGQRSQRVPSGKRVRSGKARPQSHLGSTTTLALIAFFFRGLPERDFVVAEDGSSDLQQQRPGLVTVPTIPSQVLVEDELAHPVSCLVISHDLSMPRLAQINCLTRLRPHIFVAARPPPGDESSGTQHDQQHKQLLHGASRN